MDELVKRSDVLNAYYDDFYGVDYFPFEDVLNSVTAVDAVEVVRCRDCKFGDWDSEPDDALVCLRTKDGFWRSGNDFCSYGEMKEGADNG